MKILVVGAQYTGLAAAQFWKANGHTLTVTTTRAARVPELQAVADDVLVLRGSDVEKMKAALRGHEAVLLSMAGGMVEKDGKVALDADAYADTYLGTARTVVAALTYAPSVRHIIFFSSTSAYGDAGGQAIVSEDTPVTPTSLFQQVYVDAEQALLQAVGPHICVMRTGNIYGPGREFSTQAAAMAGRTVPLDGDAGAMVVHRDDVVRAADFALKQNLSGLYNLVNDVTQSKREFFGIVCERAGLPAIEWKPFGAGIQQASNAKLKAVGFVFADPFAQKDGEKLL